MKVALGLPHLTENYNSRFGDALVSLIMRAFHAGIETSRVSTYRENITFARNKIASKAVAQAKADYVLFLDDDMVFNDDLLLRLLDHKKDIVGALTFIRTEPHEPSFYLRNSDKHTYNPIYTWKPKDLIECDAVGMAATLISKEVFEKMMSVSQSHKDIWGFFDNHNFTGEDLRFCQKAKELDFKVYCDTSQLVGHITQKIVAYPDYKAMAEDKVFNIKKQMAEKGYQ